MRTKVLLMSLVTLSAVVLPAVASSDDRRRGDHELQILTLSARSDMASGGDVLVRIDVPRGVALADVRIALNGVDVTGVFLPDGASHALVGLVTGLDDGRNVLSARTHRGRRHHSARLEIENHPISGPVFSGPRQQPWICETVASGLGIPPAEGPCVVPNRYDWFYRSTTGAFQPLPSVTPPFPPDLAQTTTIDGHTVNYIVRVESGTINESIYRIAIIDDPTNPVSRPWSPGGKKPGPGWNGKLSYPFGGGCSTGYRSGRNAVTSALSHDPLSLGFAVAFGTRNTLGTGCDDVVSAETVMMIKEHFIEHYGLPRFTIGSGGSGGAIQQHLIAHNYPGLLDALTPGISYPDIISVVPDVLDCRLLNNFFNNVASPAAWPGSRRATVDGYAVATAGATPGNTVCQNGWAGLANSFQNALGNEPARGFDPVVPVEVRYDPVTNPTGIRATIWDGQPNVFGRDPDTGFARSAYDNVGVQYGLNALNAGWIIKDEFLDLNEKIGGLDVDGNLVSRRSEGDLKAIEAAYRTGRVVASGENLTLPIIDTRDYRDHLADHHTKVRTFAFLDRLMKANGTTANQVNWLTAGTTPPSPNLARMALLAHDEWLEKILADTSRAPYAVKVIRNKPASLTDGCWNAAGVKHEEPATRDPSATCNQLFPIHGNVRTAAGGPLAGDVLKCQLKRIDFKDYAVSFTSAEQARLRATFPHGVCNWSKPGVKQRPLQDTWLSFGPAGAGDDDDGDEEDD